MKKFDRIFILIMTIFLLVIAGIYILMRNMNLSSGGREYRVSIERIENAIYSFEEKQGRAPTGLDELIETENVSSYPCVIAVESTELTKDTVSAIKKLIDGENFDYYLIMTDNYAYKVTYTNNFNMDGRVYLYLTLITASLFVVIIIGFIYIRQNILVPFYELSELPYELAKGNLAKPLKESKNKYFGRFMWGMDMLREHLEERKAKELELQKEKKLLLLSLSHDIKTPLNAINLYAKAVSRNLYQEEEKKKEIAQHINEKVNEIEGYMSDIVKASNEDFLTFEVNNSELYIKDVLVWLDRHYKDKMELNQIDFSIGEYYNCLVYGDKDRFIEVLQNIIENAAKYGDGRRIWLTMQREEEEYTITVSNTGCKLPDTELIHIFDSFFRGSNVGKKNGSGLGLYICRQLMHLMDGEILADIIKEENDNIMEVRVVVRVV